MVIGLGNLAVPIGRRISGRNRDKTVRTIASDFPMLVAIRFAVPEPPVGGEGERQWRKSVVTRKGVTSAWSAGCDDRNAHLAERLYIAKDRPLRDFEIGGDLLASALSLANGEDDRGKALHPVHGRAPSLFRPE